MADIEAPLWCNIVPVVCTFLETLMKILSRISTKNTLKPFRFGCSYGDNLDDFNENYVMIYKDIKVMKESYRQAGWTHNVRFADRWSCQRDGSGDNYKQKSNKRRFIEH